MTQPPDYGQTPPPSDGGGYGGYGSTPPPPPPAPPAGPTGGGDYSIGDAFSYGWTKFTQNAGIIIAITLLVLVATTAVSFILQLATPRDSDQLVGLLFTALLAAVSFVVQTFVSAFIVRAALDLTEGRPLEVGSLASRVPIGKVLILALLTGAIVFVGFLLCFIPGLIAAFLLSYSTYFLLDDGLEPVDAIKASFTLVKENVGSALGWAILATLFAFVGFCLCFVGYLVTAPVALIGTAYTYKKLSGKPVAA